MTQKTEKKAVSRRDFLLAGGGVVAGAAGGYALTQFIAPKPPAPPSAFADVMTKRGLTQQDATAALETYQPSGKYDEFYMFSSSGQAGQVFVIGVPSMRLLRVIPVFTKDSYQGYGFGQVDIEKMLADGSNGMRALSWGDTHHPEISRTNAEFDGEWLFINDKCNGRIAVVSLKDFKTKQIVKVPNMITNHCGEFATPNTEYLMCISQFPAPWEMGYVPGQTYVPFDEKNYADNFRGVMAFIAFDRAKGRFDLSKSFEIELPPYCQDLGVVGWAKADGWAFCNSFNTELAIGGDMEGRPPLETGASQNDFDFLHIVNWKKAESLVQAGKGMEMNGITVIHLDMAVAEGVLYFAPEPKSPHGCDLSPGGEYVIVSGKLAPVTTAYNIDKIKAAISAGNFERKDRYGVPVLPFDAVKEAQVEVGLGPLHTEFDDKGNAYTSLFIDSAVAKWTLGPPYNSASNAWKVVDKIPVQYNIGHLATTESNSPKPKGKYLVSLSKWSSDRFMPHGTYYDKNLQLIDISGEKMQLLYDLPIGNGEPHYAKIISAEKIKPLSLYPIGTNAETFSADPTATDSGKESVKRYQGSDGAWVTEVWGTLIRSHYTPDTIRVKQGDKVIIHWTNVETTPNASHGFALSEHNIEVSTDPGEVATVEFIADKPGDFPWYCADFCSPLHLEMMGWLIVEPKG